MRPRHRAAENQSPGLRGPPGLHASMRPRHRAAENEGRDEVVRVHPLMLQ